MLLAVDIGNSHVTCGVYDKKKWVHNLRISSDLNFWNQFSTTGSIGVARTVTGESLDDLYQRADKACYLAKDNGRNRVEAAG